LPIALYEGHIGCQTWKIREDAQLKGNSADLCGWLDEEKTGQA
jgi:hypothetical protein